MTPKKLPPLDYLRQCLRCDAEEGKLYWLERPSWMFASEGAAKSINTQFAGKEAFTCPQRHGRVGRIANVQYLAHRIIYYMATGTEPSEIDHINGDPLDNRLENLRPVTHADNARNRARNFNSKAPAHGVQRRYGRFVASIKLEGRQIHLGSYATCEEAMAARAGAERVLGYHPNHGRAAAP